MITQALQDENEALRRIIQLALLQRGPLEGQSLQLREKLEATLTSSLLELLPAGERGQFEELERQVRRLEDSLLTQREQSETLEAEVVH